MTCSHAVIILYSKSSILPIYIALFWFLQDIAHIWNIYGIITNIKITGWHWQLALSFLQIPNSAIFIFRLWWDYNEVLGSVVVMPGNIVTLKPPPAINHPQGLESVQCYSKETIHHRSGPHSCTHEYLYCVRADWMRCTPQPFDHLCWLVPSRQHCPTHALWQANERPPVHPGLTRPGRQKLWIWTH